MEILGDFDKSSYRGDGSLTGVGKKGTGADKLETLSGKHFPRSLKLTFKQREGLIIGVTMIREEQTGPKVQIEKRAFGESRDFCSIVTGEIISLKNQCLH